MRLVVLLVASATLFCARNARTGWTVQRFGRRLVSAGRADGDDNIYADSARHKLYIPRGAVRATPAADTSPEMAALPPRLTVFDLDTLAPVNELSGVAGQGTAPCSADWTRLHERPSAGVNFCHTKTLAKLKSIDAGDARPDGIVFDASSERAFVFSYLIKNATVIDARDGTVQGTIDLGGTPE